MKTKLPIASKFVGGFVLILLGITGFLLLFFPSNIKKTLLEKELINAEVLIDVVSVGASLGLATADFEALDLTIKIAKEFPNAKYILFTDVDGNSIAEYNPDKQTFHRLNDRLPDGARINKDNITIKAPILHEGKLFGSLLLHYSLVETNLTIKYYKKLILQLAFLILIFGAGFSIALSKIATNSIKKLITASNRVTKGDLNSDVQISSKDEFGILGNTFNYMLKSLRENSQIEAKNRELEKQSEKLREHQQALEISNEKLKNEQEQVAQKNELLQNTTTHLIEKAEQLEISNNFKSEFLANMSHELRSPLNSMLILANDLVENESNNLKQDQLDNAKIIYDGGKELLTLINDILDLSKIESGKMELYPETLRIRDFAAEAIKKYRHMASLKDLTFELLIDEDMPTNIKSDGQRLKQILNNLLSNGLKFTQQGAVTVKFRMADEENFIIEVIDTGIGISESKFDIIFKAFTQADGGTTRRYGGTGLGLAITSQLCTLLKGNIEVRSEVGVGSSFLVRLPFSIDSKIEHQEPSPEILKADIQQPLNQPKKNLILIIEDDLRFISFLTREVIKMGFEVISTDQGKEGLKLAKSHLPRAIILDIGLPDVSGLSVLDNLKSDPQLKAIPVHVMTVSDPSDFKNLDVVQVITKPIDKNTLKDAFKKIGQPQLARKPKIVFMENSSPLLNAIKPKLKNKEINVVENIPGIAALEIIKGLTSRDIVVVDLNQSNNEYNALFQGFNQLSDNEKPFFIVITNPFSSETELGSINDLPRKILRGGVDVEKQVLDAITACFLTDNKPAPANLKYATPGDFKSLLGKTILLVDDDMRNLFALSKILTNKGIKVIKASNGKKALEEIEQNMDIDLILMDIMMPEMDGYESMRKIRQLKVNNQLPIIALTAKAFGEDREKCLQAGANDYMSKPIDIEGLFKLLKEWITF